MSLKYDSKLVENSSIFSIANQKKVGFISANQRRPAGKM